MQTRRGAVAPLRVVSFLGVLGLFLLSACGGKSKSYVDDQVRDIRQSQARQTADMEQLKEELRSLKGEIEELHYAVTGKTKELESKLRQFGSRVPPPEGVPAELLNQDEERIQRNSGEAAELYRSGLESLRAGDFEGARVSFENFVVQYPGTAFSDNALFWLGVVYDKLGQYDRAIVAYNRVYEEYPAEDRVPAALYRLGGTFEKMDSIPEAILALQQLQDEYPASDYASLAKKEIRELKRRKRRR